MKTEKTGWTKERIQSLLEHNDRAVERALLQIYWRQTATEQAAGAAHDHNGVGFSAFDAEFMSSLAKGLLDYGHLTTKQLQHCRPKIKRYWRQLLEIAEASPVQPKPRKCSHEDYLHASTGA